jgi:hypothetical protein
MEEIQEIEFVELEEVEDLSMAVATNHGSCEADVE